MTLKELIDQSLQISRSATSCEIPLRNCGEGFTIKMELERDEEDKLYIDVKTYAGDKEVKLYNFPML